MPDLIDYTSITKREGRQRQDINRYWDKRYEANLKVGFTNKEATDRANKGLWPRDRIIWEEEYV